MKIIDDVVKLLVENDVLFETFEQTTEDAFGINCVLISTTITDEELEWDDVANLYARKKKVKYNLL